MPGDGSTTADAAPAFRVWPPVAISVPWLVGYVADRLWFDLGRGGPVWTVLGAGLVVAFVVWNGWCLLLFRHRRTGLLPGQTTTTLMVRGPFRVSRNPLYVGLLALYAGVALLVGSVGALVLLPVAWWLLHWGAVLPEERYLHERLGEEYDLYRRQVRRWL
ncbi:methyltransferase family protein [Nocardioides sp. GXQ0305]|uniref:methyltransferase family protein n=1 Tax=Nocardioides sp. GXQ0305 TaxID=3423912 RepID=UPI003D7C6307